MEALIFVAMISTEGIPRKNDPRILGMFPPDILVTVSWNGRKFMRISIQGYNRRRDVDRLLDALNHLIG